MHTRQNLAVSLVLAISMVGIGYGADGVLPGDGLSESTAYLIEDLTDFDVFADPNNSATYWSSGVYTKLTCDPNLAGRIYTTAVITPDASTGLGFQGTTFAGVFDGDGHVIRNPTIDTADAGNDYLGLFGKIAGSGAEVKNLGIENINITGGDDSDYLGGLCGYNGYGGTITNCYATGSVTGNDYLGGLCGYNYNNGLITNCYATGSVTGNDSLGGLCGYNYHKGLITNCYATGSVTGGGFSRYLGGLCGFNYGTINNCYAVGSITGGVDSYYLGGLCGRNDEGTITNCYFYLLGGPDNSWGTALDDLQMQDAAGFAGFDFAGNSNDGEDDYWTIVNGYCPKLTWQTDDGPLVSPPVTTLSGSGYSYDPFQINSCTDFAEFRTNSSLRCGYYILTVDIDLSGDTFTIAVIDGVFGGHFDGNGHIISNITIDTAGAGNHYLGLFSTIYHASVSNLGIENINITGGDGSHYLGGLCGKNWYGTITNCYAAGSVTGGNDSDYLGGLCGRNYYGTITNCYAAGSVTGGYYSCNLGGLCGRNYYGTITNCYAIGSVTGYYWLGGLCGCNSGGTITNCYATGSVTGDDYLGGLCGYNRATITNCYATGSVTGDNYLGGLCGYNRATITNCYATGSVTGDDTLGGLCGYNYQYGTITNCFWDVETSGMADGVGNQDPDPAGVIGKTTAEMQIRSTFTDAGWDFVGETANGTDDFWDICEGTNYPRLSWQFLVGDFVCPDGVNLIDFAVLAETWFLSSGQTGYNDLCDLIDDDTIDFNDLAVFAENWLTDKM